MIKRGYVDSTYGQLHFRRAGVPGRRTPVVLFHETPISSTEYEPLLRELGRDREVIALDTPGFGMSDGPPAPVDMDTYARVMGEALDALGLGDRAKVAVFGFHTGSVLAAEVARQRPDRVGALIVAGVPLRTPEERSARLAQLPRDKGLGALQARLPEYWQIVERRPPEVGEARAAQMYAEMALGRHTYWYAYEAVWKYPFEARFAAITQPVLVLAPHEQLLEQTRRAAPLFRQGRLVEMPQWTTQWVLELGAMDLAAEIRGFLDGAR